MTFLQKPVFIIPLVWWLLAFCAGLAAAHWGGCDTGWSETCWSRWDSALYLDIAKQGHTLFPCPQLPDKWCGNAGWAPLYPLIIFILSKVGLNPALAGMLLSQIFFLALLMMAAKMANIKAFTAGGILTVGMAAFSPGSIYFQAIFPVSQTVFLLYATLYCLGKERWFWAGICAFFAVLSHSIGFFLLAVLIGWIGLEKLRKTNIGWNNTLKLLLPPMAGLGIWFLYDFIVTGHWNALFMVQSKYGHGINSPLKMLGLHLNKLQNTGFTLEAWVEIQNLFLTALVSGSVIWVFYKKRSPFLFLQGCWMLFFWFLPFSTSMDVALYRNGSNLTPGWAMFSNFRLKATLFVLFFVLWWPLAVLFFQSLIV